MSSSSQAETSETPVRAGIVGLGRSGWGIHLRNLRDHPDFEVAAACDPEEERRQEAAEAVSCATFAEPDALFASGEVDMAVIATPSHTHAELAIAALEHGLHVLVEKPMATAVAEADAMIAAAEAAQRTLTVFQSRRFDQDFLKVRSVIASGQLGDVALIRIQQAQFQRRKDWQTLRRFGGGQLNNWGPHMLDQALLLLGEGDLDVFADLRRVVSAGDAEDHVKILLRRRDGGPTVDIEITNACAYPGDTWLVMGSRGTLRGGRRRLRWKWFPEDALPPLEAEEGPAPGRAYGTGEEIPWQEEDVEVGGQETAQLYAEIAAAVRGQAPPPVDPASVRRLIKVIERCREAGGFAQKDGSV